VHLQVLASSPPVAALFAHKRKIAILDTLGHRTTIVPAEAPHHPLVELIALPVLLAASSQVSNASMQACHKEYVYQAHSK
jgi:hypothetical protein